MKIGTLTYRQALARYPEAVIEIGYRRIDASHPEYERAPVAEAPAIFVWPNRETVDPADPSGCLAVFWLREED